MKAWLAFFVLMAGLSQAAMSEDKGMCPPTPPKPTNEEVHASARPQTPPSPGATFAGTVSLLAAVSDTGYACSVQLIRGFEKSADKQATRAIREWHFDPAQKDGKPVPSVVTMEVDFWRKPGGKLVQGTPVRAVK